jgi:hypothetical protein
MYSPYQGNIEGEQWDAPALALNNGITIPATGTEILDPSAWRSCDYIEENYVNEAKNSSRTRRQYSLGFRWHCEIVLDYLDDVSYKILVPFINGRSMTTVLRVWPHKSQTRIFEDCLLTSHSFSYLADSPIGYVGVLIFDAITRRGTRPLFEKHYHLTDSDLTTYVPADEIMHFTDSDLTVYQPTDKVGYFCDTEL